MRSLICLLLLSSLVTSLPQQDGVSHDFMGFDTGNPEADFEAGMWTAALIGQSSNCFYFLCMNFDLFVFIEYSAEKIAVHIVLTGTLMAAVPVALLNPSLGFRRKRRSVTDGREFLYRNKKILNDIIANIEDK